MLKRFAMVLSAAGLAMTVACSQTDPGITTAVKARLAADDTVKAYEIAVATNNRVVTLTGSVDSAAARAQAIVIARQTVGVSDVVDHLATVPAPEATTGRVESAIDRAEEAITDTAHEGADAVRDTTRGARTATENAAHDVKVTTGRAADKAVVVLTDTAVTSAVKTKFFADTAVSGLAIDVETTDGVVTLAGTVKSRAEADKAVAIARHSAGVKRVIDRLHVE